MIVRHRCLSMALAVFTLKVSGGCPAPPGFSGLENNRLLLAANCISSQHGTERLNLAMGWELQGANAMHEGSYSTLRAGCGTPASPPLTAGRERSLSRRIDLSNFKNKS